MLIILSIAVMSIVAVIVTCYIGDIVAVNPERTTNVFPGEEMVAMYHGSYSLFDYIDGSKLKNFSYGEGFYVTNTSEVANMHGLYIYVVYVPKKAVKLVREFDNGNYYIIPTNIAELCVVKRIA